MLMRTNIWTWLIFYLPRLLILPFVYLVLFIYPDAFTPRDVTRSKYWLLLFLTNQLTQRINIFRNLEIFSMQQMSIELIDHTERGRRTVLQDRTIVLKFYQYISNVKNNIVNNTVNNIKIIQ